MYNLSGVLIVVLYLSVCACGTIPTTFQTNSTFTKCCEPHQVIQENNNSYTCVNTTVYQLTKLIATKPTIIDKPKPAGAICYEVLVNELFNEIGVHSFKLTPPSDSKISFTLLTLVKNLVLYPKCCPLSHYYDTSTHSCVPSKNNVNGLDTNTTLILRTGLAHCTTIVDYKSSGSSPDNSWKLDSNDQTLTLAKTGVRYRNDQYCVDRDEMTGEQVARVCQKLAEVCKGTLHMSDEDGKGRVRCLKKCCPDGHQFVGTRCTPMFEYGLNVSHARIDPDKDNNNFAVTITPYCKKYIASEKLLYSVDVQGRFHFVEEGIEQLFDTEDNMYCTEYHKDVMKFFICYLSKNSRANIQLVSVIFMGISVVFLTITLLVYLVVPHMQNLHGKITMAHCLSLLVLFACLVPVNLYRDGHSSFGMNCATLGFFILFASYSTFVWLNIISFDIWYNIGSMRVRGIARKSKDLKKFLVYCSCGWGLPLLFTLFAYFAKEYKFLPEKITPNWGKTSCYLEQRIGVYDYYIFHFAPLTILFVFNIVCFGRTLAYCFKVKAEINRMREMDNNKHTIKQMFQADKERVVMLFKLIIVMGITWIFELIGYMMTYNKNFEKVEFVFDIVNSLQGVWIFCIYVLKQKVFDSIRSLVGMRVLSQRGSSSNQNTSETNIANTQLLTNNTNVSKIQ